METRDMFRLFINSNGLIYELRKVEVPRDTRSGDYMFIDCNSIALYLHTSTTVLACVSIANKISCYLSNPDMPRTGNVFAIIKTSEVES